MRLENTCKKSFKSSGPLGPRGPGLMGLRRMDPGPRAHQCYSSMSKYQWTISKYQWSINKYQSSVNKDESSIS